ncbi:hypothetical protein BZG77_09145 [Salinivibrio sp. IB643]|nr:hypothetical protein BZG77_09145 [Salinivibrio sp. IB643]
MVPLALVTQAPVRCWISAHCQRAPVALRLSRSAPTLTLMSDGAQRKSHQACAIEKALMPTYAWFIYRWCHWLRLLVPTLLRGNAYNDKIYTSMVPLA